MRWRSSVVLTSLVPAFGLVLRLHLLDVGPQRAHLVVLVLLEIKVVLLTETELEQVVI